MAIVTLAGHVSRALEFYKRTDIFYGIGGLQSWELEDVPETPNIEDTIDDIAGYKRVETMFMVYPDPENGTLKYRDSRWSYCTPEEAYEKGARWVYLMSYIAYTELPTNISYRKIGIYTGLTLKEDVPNGTYAVLPEMVEKPGILEVIDYRKPIYREADTREQLVVILEF